MYRDDVDKKQEEQEKGIWRNHESRGSLGSVRPHKSIVDGHTSPCEDCGVIDWKSDDSRGEVSCNNCGLVVEENTIDPGAEWTNFENSSGDRSRVGQAPSYLWADRGLNTHISRTDLTSSGASRYGISSKNLRAFRRRRVIDERSQTRKSRMQNLIKANDLIKNFSGLTKPQQEVAARLYSKLSMSGYVAGRSIDGVVAAVCYLVARDDGTPVQIKELVEKFKVNEKMLSRMIRQIARKLGLQKLVSPETFFNKLISKLDLPPSIRKELDAMWAKVKPKTELWQGKKPVGVAAAIVYA
ncbi:MAG: TFIIB-type zinc ribbon-containing protein, partial [Euryarchaeota archaeon]